ncbi:MAG: hypothetical protein DSY84_05410 [Candidatus Neomarinimicrobiota bacterium]|nr:MAG: hypothetical protein DSY84_05410 [Candidatus Neomarinimicrobiota bacterium]
MSVTCSRIRDAPETRFFVSGSMICSSTATPTVAVGDPLKWMRIRRPSSPVSISGRWEHTAGGPGAGGAPRHERLRDHYTRKVTRFRTPRTALTRYVLYQIPGGLLAAAGALLLHRWVGLPGWVAIALVVGWALKDAALYPFLRASYEPHSGSVIERLVGLGGIAVEPLAPRGYVRIRGELWLAEPIATDVEIPRGHPVTVDGVRGTTLLVRPTGSIRNIATDRNA